MGGGEREGAGQREREEQRCKNAVYGGHQVSAGKTKMFSGRKAGGDTHPTV